MSIGASELQIDTVRAQVALSLITEFENFNIFKPGDYQLPAVEAMLDQLIAWTKALEALRTGTPVA